MTERDSDTDGRADRDEFYTDGGDEIPLNIAGHEDRERPGESADDDGDSVLEFSEDEALEASGSADYDGGVDGDGGEDGDGNGDGDDETVEPVELLVQLAENGEIDPWDIDIVHVTDRFLDALDEVDLRTSGRALFYASVLLRMKSDELFAAEEPDEEEELPPWEAPFADDGAMAGDADEDRPPGFDPVENLEAEMERRLERKHARGKPETLDELVRELRSAERDSRWKESRSYDTSDSPSGYDRGVQELSYRGADDMRAGDEPTSDDVTHTTHEEDIEDVIDDVEDELAVHYDQGRDEVLYAEIDDAGGSRVMTYLALLFLAHRGRVTLEQDDLFGDLWIQRVSVEAEPEEAIAD
ncbi:segregation/condensation protein A [Halobiforma lacisalsi AJ5]|uniref:Chromosome segregation and condensation protein ScpA n=1 Tax=Natronobacterium lacisalsi AJ5 TaxID=358396 RepID=M0LIN6_NATLA|nr:ScpA family protein [Halobiforma lacisalsi]APW96368.1 segregation/condensation protein A [Halobiforma lacisalsi AJ5]EMA31865.1 chromosome segregation and condensation protein ScpA [Halobiforma lacisalsi AJ5]